MPTDDWESGFGKLRVRRWSMTCLVSLFQSDYAIHWRQADREGWELLVGAVVHLAGDLGGIFECVIMGFWDSGVKTCA